MPAGERRRSRSRGRRRRRPSQGISSQHQRLDFGRHHGHTYADVQRRFPGYCTWALTVPNPGGGLREFQRWLLRQRRQGTAMTASNNGASRRRRPRAQHRSEEEGSGGDWNDPLPYDPLGSSDAESFGPGGSSSERSASSGMYSDNTEPVHLQPVQPRDPGLAAILEGLPRVEFTPALFSGSPHPQSCPICMEDFGSQGPDSAEIVLTPCLHAFHLPCLLGWAARQRDCPTCRWDMTNLGEQGAVGYCAPGAGVPGAAALGNVAIVLSDDSQT